MAGPFFTEEEFLRNEVGDLTLKTAQLEASIHGLEGEVESKQQQLVTITAEANLKDDQIAGLQAQLRRQQQVNNIEVEGLRLQLSEKNEEIKAYAGKLSRRDARIEDLTSALADAEVEIQRKQQTVKDVQDRMLGMGERVLDAVSTLRTRK